MIMHINYGDFNRISYMKILQHKVGKIKNTLFTVFENLIRFCDREFLRIYELFIVFTTQGFSVFCRH